MAKKLISYDDQKPGLGLPGVVERALSETFALKDAAGSSSPTLEPFYVSTYDLSKATAAPAGVRTGLDSSRVQGMAGDGSTASQGYVSEREVTGVSGTAGDSSLATTDTSALDALAGASTTAWAATVVDGATGKAFPVGVVSASGGTVKIAHPLPIDVTDGTLYSWMDEAQGQHLTRAGYRALAQHIASASPLVGTRGGIIDGQWDTLPPQYRQPWVENAALAAYGVQDSESPVVRSEVSLQLATNPNDTSRLTSRINTDPGGMRVGTHEEGHGAIATLRAARRPVVVEFHTRAARSTSIVTSARVRATVTTADGSVLYDRVVGGVLDTHRVPLAGSETAIISVTNIDGGIYSIEMGQLTVREAGQAPVLAPRKALLLGDSWTQFYDHLLGDELAEALGCEVVTFGKGGTTTDWGIAWLDTALAANPGCDTVILHFYTNDLNNNQGSAMTLPDGTTAPMWPDGLTSGQARARWVSQIGRLVSMCQQRGLRPVVVGPGGVNVNTQFAAALALETPRLVEWNATFDELADPSAYVNLVGKTAGSQVAQGAITKTATGPLPEDQWVSRELDLATAALRGSLDWAQFNADPDLSLGSDTDDDGLSDGFSWLGYGDNSGHSFTPSIVEGRQRIATTYGSTSGNERLAVYFPVEENRDYLVAVKIVNSTPSARVSDSVTNIPASTIFWPSGGSVEVDSAGEGLLYVRATASATKTAYAAIQYPRAEGESRTLDVESWRVADLTALFEYAPGLAGLSTPELAEFVVGIP